MALCVKSCFRCSHEMEVRAGTCVSLWCRSHLLFFGLAGPQLGGSHDELLSRCDAGVGFLRKPRAKRCFLRVGPSYDAGTIGALKPWQLSQKVVLRARASHETDIFSKLRSRCGAAPIWGIRVLPQNSMASAAFCETAGFFSGGHSVLCADAIGRYRMRGRRSTFIKRVCEFRGRRSVSLIRKRCGTKVNPLRRSLSLWHHANFS